MNHEFFIRILWPSSSSVHVKGVLNFDDSFDRWHACIFSLYELEEAFLNCVFLQDLFCILDSVLTQYIW